ncbi:hypothetical protein MalM25_19620 [Planctomycetes bacterium MalM25]|nr:hypothetical protein MalM25_19620 [Planctomycetes bacterium MalM25]
MSPRAERRCLIAMIGLSLVLHLFTVGGQALFVDEVAHFQHARLSWSELAWHTDSMPPLYALVVKTWASLCGEGAGLRWFSVAASLATIPLVWRIGRRWGQDAGLDAALAGVASAGCFAALPLQLYYAQLIRGYALTTLAAALAILAFVQATASDSRRDWLRFAAAGVFGMWTHYYFAFVLVLLLVALVLKRGVNVGRGALASAGLIGLGCLPLLPFLQADFAYQRDLREPRPLDAVTAAYTGLSYFSGYTLGPAKGELHQASGREAARQAAPWGVAVALTAGMLAALGVPRLARGDWLMSGLLLTFGAIALVGGVGAAMGLTFNPRFVAWCSVPISAWVGVGVASGLGQSKVTRRVTALACLGLLTISTVALINRHAVDRYRTEDLPSAVTWLVDNGLQDAPLFVVSDYLAPQIEFHAGLTQTPLAPVRGLPRPGRVDQEIEEPGLVAEAIENVEQLAGGEEFYLIECRAFHTDPHGLLREALRERAGLEPVARFAGVIVHRGRLRD